MNQLKCKGYAIDSNKTFGKGDFSTIYEAKQQNTQTIVAVKVIDKNLQNMNSQNYKSQEDIFREIKTISQGQHQNILPILDYNQNQHYRFLVLEKCDGNLDELMRYKYEVQKQCFTEQESISLIIQIYEAYALLAFTNISHRNMEPKNILIKNGSLKINYFTPLKQFYSSKLATFFKESNVQIREQVIKKCNYFKKCNIWALGFIFYRLLHGRLPWDFDQDKSMINMFEEHNRKPQTIQMNQKLSKQTKDFLQYCLQIKQDKDYSWERLKQQQTPFFGRHQAIKHWRKEHIQNISQLMKLFRSPFKISFAEQATASTSVSTQNSTMSIQFERNEQPISRQVFIGRKHSQNENCQLHSRLQFNTNSKLNSKLNSKQNSYVLRINKVQNTSKSESSLLGLIFSCFPCLFQKKDTKYQQQQSIMQIRQGHEPQKALSPKQIITKTHHKNRQFIQKSTSNKLLEISTNEKEDCLLFKESMILIQLKQFEWSYQIFKDNLIINFFYQTFESFKNFQHQLFEKRMKLRITFSILKALMTKINRLVYILQKKIKWQLSAKQKPILKTRSFLNFKSKILRKKQITNSLFRESYIESQNYQFKNETFFNDIIPKNIQSIEGQYLQQLKITFEILREILLQQRRNYNNIQIIGSIMKNMTSLYIMNATKNMCDVRFDSNTFSNQTSNKKSRSKSYDKWINLHLFQKINQWIEHQTNKNIKSFIEENELSSDFCTQLTDFPKKKLILG